MKSETNFFLEFELPLRGTLLGTITDMPSHFHSTVLRYTCSTTVQYSTLWRVQCRALVHSRNIEEPETNMKSIAKSIYSR